MQQSADKKNPQTSRPSKHKQSEKQGKKIHRGVFIADQRRKGNNGRIKSQSIPNKIEVRLRRDIAYLHETEVEWVEVGRYSKKQGRGKNKNQKKVKKEKNLKFKAKQEQNQKKPAFQPKKYVLKHLQQLKAKQQAKQQQTPAQTSKQETLQETKIEQSESQIHSNQPKQEKTQKTENNNDNKNEQEPKNEQRDEESSSENSQQDEKHDNKEQPHSQKSQQPVAETEREGEQKKEEDDIVIIAEIKKQISNPFWSKPFVGVLLFNEKSKKQQEKYKQKKKQRSHVSKILDDFDLDFDPIHMRLPRCYVNINNNTEKVLEEYAQKHVKIEPDEKGGKIRNKILDQLESTYALVKFSEIYKGNVYVQLTKIIGKARTIEGQCNCFLYEHQLNDFEHEEQKQKTIPQLQLNASPLHKNYEEMVFTIDPLTSTDLDDALSVRRLSETEYQFGIHISDVSSYIHNIPREQILRRTTSVYLPHKVFHMLPSHLVTICSLNPNVKRLAFSVFVKMNDNADILETRIQKNVLMSRFKLAYEQAQSVITGQMDYDKFNQLHQCTEQEYKSLVQKIKIMEKVSMAHRKKRLLFQIFDNDQIKFELDEQKWPINLTVASRFTAQKMIEEFMIIGNIQTAKKAAALDPTNSLIIHHPGPSDLAIRQFNQFFHTLNYKFKFEDTMSLQKDLLKVKDMENVSEDIKKLCYFKARRAQQTASYKRFSEVQSEVGNVHFALGLRYYTHFTSPMRRVADILVHEVLNASLDPNIPKKELLQKQIEAANWGRKNTKRLKKDLNQIYLCLMLFKTKKTLDAQAIVSSFGCKSVSVYIPFLDMSKEIMWKDMEVNKAVKNKKDSTKVDVIIYFDKRDARNDIIWVVEKFIKFPIKIGCSEGIPLKLTFQFEVKTNNGIRRILPYE